MTLNQGAFESAKRAKSKGHARMHRTIDYEGGTNPYSSRAQSQQIGSRQQFAPGTKKGSLVVLKGMLPNRSPIKIRLLDGEKLPEQNYTGSSTM